MHAPAKSLLLVSLAAAALLWSCSGTQPFNAEARSVKNRKAAADFSLHDANGSVVKLSDYRGKVVLLNFWATWCGPCTLEIPWFIEFEQQYKTRGFAVVGVSMDEDGWAAIKPYMAEHKMNYRVLLGDDSVSQLYGGVDALPTTFIIDRAGRVAFPAHVGLAGKNEYLKEIQSLLNEQQQTSLFSRPAPFAALRLGAAK
jgi:peroxiredoxin